LCDSIPHCPILQKSLNQNQCKRANIGQEPPAALYLTSVSPFHTNPTFWASSLSHNAILSCEPSSGHFSFLTPSGLSTAATVRSCPLIHKNFRSFHSFIQTSSPTSSISSVTRDNQSPTSINLCCLLFIQFPEQLHIVRQRNPTVWKIQPHFRNSESAADSVVIWRTLDGRTGGQKLLTKRSAERKAVQ
jgi:hypothetical protein